MSSDNKELPNFIQVARLRDIYWNNNSDLYPNEAPQLPGYQVIENITPIFFMSGKIGSCVLTGDFNHAFYNGQYFFLTKIKPIDLTDNTFEYQLDYDVMMNLLHQGGEIKGTLIRTSRQDILSKVVQTTTPILSNPIKLVVGKFNKTQLKWKRDVEVILPEEFIKMEWGITAVAWNAFFARLKTNPMIKTMKKQNWQTSGVARSQRHTFNPLFLIDSVEITEVPSWKNLVYLKIEEMLMELVTKAENSNFEIRSSPKFSKTKLGNLKFLTYNDDDGLGTTVENELQLKTIDLSKLTDIIPLDSITLEPAKPTKKPTLKDITGGDYEIQEPIFPGWFIELCRYPYLPLRPKGESLNNKNPYMPLDHPSHSIKLLKNWEETNYTGNKPQFLEFKQNSGFSSNTGWLWYINRLDFSLINGWRTIKNKNDTKYWFNQRSFFDDGKDYGSTYYFRNFGIPRRDYPGLGFLIFQLKQPYDWFDEYQYLGDTPTKTFKYRSGIRNSLSYTYDGTKSFWYSSIKPNLGLHLAGCDELSRFILDIDLLRWVFLAPSPTDYLYKWWNSDYYGISRYFASGRSITYPAYFVNYDIQGSGEKLVNPLSKERIKDYKKVRIKKIDDFSFYKEFEIPFEVTKNDIFCSDIEYIWKQTPFSLARFPSNILDPELWNESNLQRELDRVTVGGTIAGVGLGYTAKVISERWGALGAELEKRVTFSGTDKWKAASGKKYIADEKLRIDKQLRHYKDMVRNPKNYSYKLQSEALREYTSPFTGKRVKVDPSKLPGFKSLKDLKSFAKTQVRNLKLDKKNLFVDKIAIGAKVGGRGAKAVGALWKVWRGARAAAAIKSLGLTLLAEALWFGLEKYAEANSPDTENRLTNSILTLGDFFGGSKYDTKNFNNQLVVYLHQNKVKIGVYREYVDYHTLSNNEEQAIDKVDGLTTRKTTYYHIREVVTLKHKDNVMWTDSDMTKLVEEGIFAAKTTPETIDSTLAEDGKIFNFTLEELEDTKQPPLFFDLVGTDWIVCFYKGRPNLIAKNMDPFTKNNLDNDFTHTVEFPEGVIPTTNEVINQKSFLVSYGQPRLLNTKFDFIDNNWSILTRVITPVVKQSNIEYIQLVADNDYDYINEWIQAFKQTKAGVEFDPVEFEMLKLQADQLHQQYIQFQQDNELSVHRQKVETARKFEDLDINWWKSVANIATAGAAGAVIGGVKGGVAGAAKGAVGGAIGGLVSGGSFIFKDYYTMKGRVAEDQLLFMQQNTQNLYHRKQNYELDFRRHTIQLNALSNTYVRPGVNDTEIQQVFNKLNGWEDINVQVFLPDARQLDKINQIYKTFGCECVSDEFKDSPLLVTNGMDVGVYQFEKLGTNGVVSRITSDLDVNQTVRNIFESGVRFDEANHIFEQEEEAIIIVPKETPIEFDLDKIKEWSQEVWDTYVITKPKTEILKTIKGIKNYGLSDDEYTANKAKLDAAKDNDEELFKVVDDISSHRRTGSVYVVPTVTQDTVEAGIIHDLKSEINKAREALAKAQADKADCESNITKLQTAKEQVEKINKALVDEIAKIKRAKEALEEQLKECADDKAQIATLTEQIQKLTKDIQDKEDALKTCNERIKALEAQIQQNQAKLTEYEKLKTEVGNLKQQLVEKTRERDQLQNTANTAQNNLNAKTEELRQCTINLVNVQQAKATCDRINAEEQKRLKKELDECKKSKDDREKQLQDELDKAKQACAEEKRRLQEELDECKKHKPSDVVPNTCELLHKYIKEAYPITNKSTDQGTYAEFLLLKLAENIHIATLSHLSERLSKYPLIAKIFPLLNELEENKAIGIYLDAMNLEGWDSYIGWKYENKSWRTEASEVINIVNEVIDNISTVNLIGVKTILDEIAYLAYEAKLEHEKKNKKDPDNEHRDVSDIDLDVALQYFFTSIVGNYKTEYKNLFNEDLDDGVRKRKFLKAPCETQTALTTLDSIDKQTTFSVEGIPINKHPPGLHFFHFCSYGARYNTKRIISRKISDITPVLVDRNTFNTNIVKKYKNSYIKPGDEIYTVSNYKSGYTSRGVSYTWIKLKLFQPGDRSITEDSNYGFYMRNAQKSLRYEYAHQIRNKILEKVHNRLDQENIRQFIRENDSLCVKVVFTSFQNTSTSYSGTTLFIGSLDVVVDLIKSFGKEDAYYALQVLLILAWNNIINIKQLHREPKYEGVYYAEIKTQLVNTNPDSAYEYINQSLTRHFETNNSLANYTFYIGWWSYYEFMQYISLCVKTKKFPDLYSSSSEGGLRWLLSILPG